MSAYPDPSIFPEPAGSYAVEIALRLTAADAARFQRAVRHWEYWHNCTGLIASLDREGKAVQRGLTVMEAIESWAEDEGCRLDGGDPTRDVEAQR